MLRRIKPNTPWISAVILLPTTPRRATLRSFCLVCCLVGAACFGVVLPARADIALCGIVAIVFIGSIGWVFPKLVNRPYRIWNGFARCYAGIAERTILRICYATVMIPAGWTETALRLRRPASAESLWTPRASLSASSYQQLHSYPCSETRDTGWVRRYVAWARSSNQVWVLALLPFLCVLSWLKNDEETVVRESIYTLF